MEIDDGLRTVSQSTVVFTEPITIAIKLVVPEPRSKLRSRRGSQQGCIQRPGDSMSTTRVAAEVDGMDAAFSTARIVKVHFH